ISLYSRRLDSRKRHSMLTHYLKTSTTQRHYLCGTTGSYLDEFSRWLEQRGYQQSCICRRLRRAHRGVFCISDLWQQLAESERSALSPVLVDVIPPASAPLLH